MANEFSKDHTINTYPMAVSTTTLQNSTVFDMTGYEGIIAIGGGGTTEANTSGGLSWSVGSASGSLSQTTGIQNLSLKTIYLDHFRPAYQFVRANWLTSVTTTGAAISPLVTVIRYGARTKPVTQDASTTGKVVYTPGTGTATG